MGEERQDIAMDRGNKLALLWRRDAPKWQAATAENYRLHRGFEELAALGIQAEPALYADNGMEKVRK
jgi:hypothetical protein